jgi:hypothetical protein
MRGVVRVVVPTGGANVSELARAAQGAAFDGTIAIENLPPAAWTNAPLAPASDPTSRAIRAKFDPDRILNPGILGAS